ncbi:MAG: DUF4292 domain-containing protein [Bacteroidota bacterium]
MNYHKHFALYFILILTIGLCTQCSVTKKNTSISSNYKSFTYKTIDAKSSGIYNDAFNEQNFNAYFRIEKNKYIWVSLTGPLSIEGARILIKPDSVAVIDRINKKYYSGSYSAFQQKYHIPLAFNEIQQILVGDISMDAQKENCVLSNDLQVCTIKNDSAVFTYMLNPKNYTLEKMRVKDRFSVRELSIKFASYQIISGKLFSFNKEFEINTQNELLKLQLDFNKVEFDKTIDCSFSIPETYQKSSF